MNANTKEIFPQRLIEQREIKGVSRQTAADELEISRASLEYYEKGLRVPDVVVLAKLADYYNVSADYLLGRSDVRSVDPSQKIHVACEVTGLSEKAVNNLVEINSKGLKVNLLLENSRIKGVIEHLGELERLAINKKYWEQVIDPVINDDEFFDGLRLNGDCLGKPKCRRYNEHNPDDIIDCQNCGSDCFRKTDSEYIYNLIKREFDEMLESDLGFYINSQADCSSCYQDNADLEHFKLSKAIDALIEDTQANADFSIYFAEKNQKIRKSLIDKLDEANNYIAQTQNDKQLKEFYQERFEIDLLEAKALQTYLDKYDENFKLKEQKGAPNNGSNNPKKE